MTETRLARILSPFHARSRTLDVVRGHDLTGRTALVTGASSGLGVETARALVEVGAKVVLPTRSVER